MKKIATALVFVGLLFLSSSFAYSQNSVSDTSEENPLKIVLDEVDAGKRSEISAYRNQLIGHGDYKPQFAKLKSDLNDLYNIMISPTSTQKQVDEAAAEIAADEAKLIKIRVDMLYFISQRVDRDKRSVVDPQIKELISYIDMQVRPSEHKTCKAKFN